MYYTGVGSRETPEDIGTIMTQLASELEEDGFVLRSGGADGADTFFERGVADPENMEIYLPNWRFNGREASQKGFINASREPDFDKAMQLAEQIHPAWDRCGHYAKLLHSRNVYQVLGKHHGWGANIRSNFLVCWAETDKHGVPKGGTRTAWQLAKAYNISRTNLYLEHDLNRVKMWLQTKELQRSEERMAA